MVVAARRRSDKTKPPGVDRAVKGCGACCAPEVELRAAGQFFVGSFTSDSMTLISPGVTMARASLNICRPRVVSPK